MMLWMHRNTGGEYIEIARGCMQAADNDLDDKRVVIYRSIRTGFWFVRPVAEFEDGRFVELKKPSTYLIEMAAKRQQT